MNWDASFAQIMDAIIDLKRAMVEGFGKVYARLDEHDRRFDEHDRRFDAIDRRLGRIETRVEDLERRITA